MHPVDDRLKRLDLHIGAGERGDPVGRGHRLLGGDAAVFDREVGRVAGGKYALEAADLAVRVDRDEPVGGSLGDSGR